MEIINALSLILVRHTRTDDNDDKIYSCQNDVPLNSFGLKQAFALAKTLSIKQIVAIYTSDLRRARTVAEIIGAFHRHTPLMIDARLRELNMGTLSGKTKGSVLESHPAPCFRTSDPPYDFSSVRGETRREVVSRQLAVLREAGVIHARDCGAILFVGHGTALQDLSEALGLPDKLHKQGEFTELAFPLAFDRGDTKEGERHGDNR